MTTSSWFVSRARHPAAVVRLFCIPYAGGGASCFHSWAEALASVPVELIAVQPPGRETRLLERPYTAIVSLADAIAERIAALTDRPYCVFGHSMGAIVAFETVRRLAAGGRPLPERLIVSGTNPPHRATADKALHTRSDDTFLRAVAETYGGIPDDVFREPELARLLTSVLRADMQAIETYRYEPGAPLTCPISAWSGTRDQEIDGRGFHEWARYTTGPFSADVLCGDHFSIFRDPGTRAQALAILARDLHTIVRYARGPSIAPTETE